jgi:hypothetical protein
MFTSERHPDHTLHAEILVVKFPQAQQFVDGSLLFRKTRQLRYVSWFMEHGTEVEITAQSIRGSEESIYDWIRSVGCCPS